MLSARLNATRSGLILVLVPVIFEIIFLSSLALVLHSAQSEFHRISAAKDLLLMIQNGYLTIGQSLALLGNSSLAIRPKQLQEIDRQTEIFRKHRADLEQSECPQELADCRQATIDLYDKAIKFAQYTRTVYSDPTARGPERSSRLRPEGMSLIDESWNVSKMLLNSADLIKAKEPEEIRQFRLQLALVLSFGLVSSALISWISARIFTSEITQSLARVAGNAQLIGAGKPLPPPQSGDTEIARLDRVLFHSNTLLEEARRKELSVLDNAADVICSLDENLRFVAVGQACVAVWGWEASDLLGKSLLSMLKDGTADNTRLAFDRLASTGSSGELENTIICKDRSSKISVWNITWSQEARTFTCVVHDVTELRAIEQLKRRFLSIAGHDLRSPLTSIGASLCFLSEQDKLPQECKKELGETGKNLTRLLDLIEDILSLERLQSHITSITPACVSAYDICVSAKESLAPMASFHEIELGEISGDGPISGDETHLCQAVTKLLSAAIQAASVQISTRIISHDDAEDVEIRFSFDTTKEVEEPATSNLALQLAKAIAELHKGTIGIESGCSAWNSNATELRTTHTYWIKLPVFQESARKTTATESEPA